MAILASGETWTEDEQVTHTKLNAAVNAATFDDPADETTIEVNSGQLRIKDAGVVTAKVADAAITNEKLAPTSGTAAVSGSASAATGTNVIEALSITTAELDDDCINSDKIAADAVKAEHVDIDAITGQTILSAIPDIENDSILLADGGAAGALKEILLRYLPMPKAYGIVDFNSASRTTITGDYNVSSVTGDTDYREINLSVTMGSATDYVITTSPQDETGQANNPVPNVDIVDADTFRIYLAEGANLRVHFSVLGDLA